jgi:PAS domain S-box-containing protein
MFAESVSNLTGGSTNIVQMEGRWFSEEKMSSKLSGNDMLLALFEVIKITLNYLFGDHQEAYKHVENALKYRDSLNPHYLYTKISFYGGLSCIGSLVESENDADRQDRLKKLEQFEVELKLWAEVAPMNYQHQYDLVMAEKCRISDRHWEAAQLYEKAIKGAQENQFVHDEALAHELSGQFWLEQGNDRIAEMYMREASSLYHQWGAGAKVSHLEECYPVWFKPETILSKKAEIPSGADKTQTTITQPISSIQLDLDTIISTSQMLSAETDLEQLLSKMITLVMANSGAETAVLLLKQDNGWFVQARGDITSEKYDVLLNQPFDPADNEAALVPECVFNYCQRSREVLVVGDAQSDQRFGQDRTIQTHNIKSMACIPVLNHGELKGMLYLENRQMADVFTLERLEILKHLSSQFGISAENALLYENLNNNIQELQESEMRFRSVVENANETILVTQDELVKYSNQKVEELIGYSMEEMSTLGFEKFIHPDDLNIVLYEHQTRISGEKPANNYTIRIITKAGQVKYVVVNSGMINWDGRPASLAMITDITDLKKKEWNLLQAQKIARLGFYDWDFQKDRLYPSEELIRIIGKGFDGEYTTSEYISSIVHPDDLDFVRENLELAIKGEKKYEIEHRILRPDGTVIWVASQAELFHDTNGKPERLIGTEVDITEQKKVQEKLKKSEERFRHLMEQSPMAMEILSPDGKIKVVNSAWKKLWKISDEAAAETIDKYNMLTDPQLEKLGIMDQVKEAFKGKHVILPPIQYDTGQTVDDFDIGILKKLRSPWIQCHLNAVKDDEGNIVFIVNTYVDITDLNKAMESVQKSEVFFRNLMEFSPLSIAIFRPDGKLIQVNTAWRELWGLSEEETARVMAKYNFRRDKQIEALGHAPLLERAFNGEHVILPTMDYEGRHTAENVGLDDIEPKTRTIQTHIYSVKDANGKIDYVVNINMDLTELRQAEQEAKQQRDVLARIDRASSMGQLTGSIAHELNQPLTGILSNAQAAELILQSKNYDLEEIKEILTEIVSDTKRAGQVIRNLRELYKEQKVELLPVEINTVVQEAVNLLQSEFVVRKVNLAMQYDNANPLVKGNKIQIQQVVFNLITNGIQAMTDKVRNERNLWITTSYETNEVKVCVIDSGQGINPKFIDNIFEPLATWKPDGTGMGLAISKSIIQAHGGRMIAENRPKGGACVCFILPSILKK